MKRWGRTIKTTLAALLVLFISAPLHVQAAGNCGVGITPLQVSYASSTIFTLSITNNGSNDIQWVDITVPTTAFNYTGNSVSGWSSADHSGGTTFTGAVIPSGQTVDFGISAQAAIGGITSGNWQVQTAEDAGGVGAVSCSGNTTATLSGHPPNDTDVGVSSIQVTDISTTSATVTWNSDVDTTGVVFYGTTSDYGSLSGYNTNYGSVHTATISGLSPSSSYHFQVGGQDASFGVYYSADNTFTTLTSVSSSGNGSGSSQQAVTTVVPIKTKPAEHVPPTVELGGDFTHPFKITPSIGGTAADNEALAAVEYSTDGGKNWLPVDNAPGIGGKSVTFSFTPKNLDDGNYQIVARAIDTSGNITLTTQKTLIIDKLPPIVGGNVVSVGPQIVTAESNGRLQGSVGVNQKITMSAIGGATSVTVNATQQGLAKTSYHFHLLHQADSGLWAGIMSFLKTGNYQLSVTAIDGAGNTTSRDINTITVSPAGLIKDKKTSKPLQATITVYYRDTQTNNWTVWDASTYSQTMPYVTSKQGEYSMLLPEGTYYLDIRAPGHTRLVSRSFSITKPTVIAQDYNLEPNSQLVDRLLSTGTLWPTLGSGPLEKVNSAVVGPAVQNPAVGTRVPKFTLPMTNGEQLQTNQILGKPTIMTLISTWSPLAVNQLSVMSDMNSKGINIYPVAIGESAGKVIVNQQIGGYKLPVVIDEDQQLATPMNIMGLPTHYFIDRHGVVKKVMVGVLSSKELLKNVQY